MTTQKYTQTDCLNKIASAWATFNTALAGLSETDLTVPRDAAGWNAKDHIAHLAAWEESIVMLFQGQARYTTLGVNRDLYEEEKIDEVNAAIQRRWAAVPLADIWERIVSVHAQMMALVNALSDGELNQTMQERFAQISMGDTRKLAAVILANTEYHFLEHLPWILALAQ